MLCSCQEFYAAKREAARVARQEKVKQEKKSINNKADENQKMPDDAAFAAWLSDDDEIDE